MKKWLIALLTLLALSLSVAFAAEANDITEDCKFKVCSSGRKYTLMTDKKYTSYWESNKIKTPWIAITAPEGKPIAGLYVCFGNMPESWEIQTSDDGKDWFTAVPGDTRFLHAYVALPQPAQHVRLAVTSEKKPPCASTTCLCFLRAICLTGCRYGSRRRRRRISSSSPRTRMMS